MLVNEKSGVPMVAVAPAEPLIVVGVNGAADKDTAMETFLAHKGEEPEQVLHEITPDTHLGPTIDLRSLVLLDLAEFTNGPWRQMGALLRLLHDHTPRWPITINVPNDGGSLDAHVLHAAGALQELRPMVSVWAWQDGPVNMPINQMPVLPHRAELDAFQDDTAEQVPDTALKGFAYTQEGDRFVLTPAGAMLRSILVPAD
ncbi:hypothetical protein [Nocardiopsis sp. FR26]|uniref:hypothetical protein n=1 Tax=Nocardiopsis sp. FR26 TaxID=2605987 RepID=UPI00135B1A00|nr:hypothetical protein [Nocardiopsis sp. FR26]